MLKILQNVNREEKRSNADQVSGLRSLDEVPFAERAEMTRSKLSMMANILRQTSGRCLQ